MSQLPKARISLGTKPGGGGGGRQVSFPRPCCHLPASAALQASGEALLAAAELLKWKELKRLVQTQQTWRIGECLVRTSPKAQGPGWTRAAPRVRGVGPAACALPALLPPGASSFFPVLENRAPKGSSPHPSPLPTPGGREGSQQRRMLGGGTGPANWGGTVTFPSPCALSSWGRTGAGLKISAAGACHTCRMLRTPCERRP